MRKRANRLMGGGRIVYTDSFTEADGTTLADHVGESGKKWNLHSLFTDADIAVGVAAIDSGRVHMANVVAGRYYHLGRRPKRRNGRIEADFVMKSDNNLSWIALILNLHTVRANMVYARYNTNGNIWQILRVRDGSTTSLGSSSATLTVDQTYRLAYERRGSRFLARVDGALLLNFEDPANYSGLPGLRFGDNATPTTGIHGDNLLVTR